jgi:PKD repeat protein
VSVTALDGASRSGSLFRDLSGGTATWTFVAESDTTLELEVSRRDWESPTDWSVRTGDAAGENLAPSAVLDYAPSNPTAGESVSFDASGSTDADGAIATYEWDFDGDGTVDATTADPRVTHAYAATGEYDATVTVSDGAGATDAATRTVAVGSSGGGGDAPSPVGGSSAAPRDPDGDGRYEDVDGDGTVGVGDVATLFYNLDGAAVGDAPDAFDFNGDGSCDVIDVSALFDQLP